MYRIEVLNIYWVVSLRYVDLLMVWSSFLRPFLPAWLNTYTCLSTGSLSQASNGAGSLRILVVRIDSFCALAFYCGVGLCLILCLRGGLRPVLWVYALDSLLLI